MNIVRLLALAGIASLSLYACLSDTQRYGVEMQLCVEKATTLAESKACRAEVRREHGLDAGQDGAP